jgi:hypothetical protein
LLGGVLVEGQLVHEGILPRTTVLCTESSEAYATPAGLGIPRVALLAATRRR